MTIHTAHDPRLERLEAGQEALLGAVSANTTTLQLVLATLERVAMALERPDDGSLAEALRGVEAQLAGLRREILARLPDPPAGVANGMSKLGPVIVLP